MSIGTTGPIRARIPAGAVAWLAALLAGVAVPAVSQTPTPARSQATMPAAVTSTSPATIAPPAVVDPASVVPGSKAVARRITLVVEDLERNLRSMIVRDPDGLRMEVTQPSAAAFLPATPSAPAK